MAELLATPPLSHAPLTLGGATLAVADLGPMTSLAPFPGQEGAVSAALAPLGLTFPAPNRIVAGAGGRILWTGRQQAFLIGAAAPQGIEALAAVTDQTDAWAAFTLSGPAAADALMRLVALDLRDKAFLPGSAARSALNHLPLVLFREGDGFTFLTFRSMAQTAWHEVSEVLAHLAARAALR